MIKVDKIEIYNFEGAVRGMRNALNSHDRSDSTFFTADEVAHINIGENDLSLMRRLYKAGTEHRKYARQIMASMDITAPRMWWTQMDTYRVGMTANSESTMHTIHKKPFQISDFSYEGTEGLIYLEDIIHTLNMFRDQYLETKDKKYWRIMIDLLPQSYNQKRTVTMNYENIFNIIKQRSGHKLWEWDSFIGILKGLPYVEAIMSE